MKAIFLFMFFCYQTADSAPFLKLTPAEYKAFEAALDGGKPLFMQSALPLLTMKNVKQEKMIFLNIGGRDQKYLATNINNSPPKGIFQNGEFQNRRPGPDVVNPIYRNELSNLIPITKRLQLIKRESGRSKREAVVAADQAADQSKTDDREKRQSDDYDEDYDYEDYEYEEEPVRYAQELSFGLSTAGGVLGGAVGGYLDTTGVATLKLIRSLESLGLIAVSQFDDFLDRQAEEKKAKEENTIVKRQIQADKIAK